MVAISSAVREIDAGVGDSGGVKMMEPVVVEGAVDEGLLGS